VLLGRYRSPAVALTNQQPYRRYFAPDYKRESGSTIGRVSKMNVRMPFDLGIERVLIDQPLAIRF
jgi:hypothetical protein